jgi:serine phosphatase RsbU (regulator of sigma subunit)
MRFDEQRFGRKRFEKALREANGSASDILNHVLWTMRRFTGIRRGLDDTTLVVIKVNPPR